jgi:hypothetical protein
LVGSGYPQTNSRPSSYFGGVMTSFEESLQEDETWLEFLDKTEKGFIKAHVRNVILALRNAKKLQGLIRQNKFKNCIEIAQDPP